MEELLLVGDNKETLRSLYDSLKSDFQVQMCSPQPAMLNGVSALMRPDIILLCLTGNEQNDRELFSWIEHKQIGVPTMVLATGEQLDPVRTCCVGDQYVLQYRPSMMRDIVDRCKMMVGKGLSDNVIPKSRLKVMVIDDSPLVLRNTKSMLDIWYDVSVVPDATKALLLMAKKRPDVVLLDYEMPVINGRELHEAMKSEEELRNIPVIFLTNISDKKQVLEVLKSNPAGYLLKPADRYQLREMIEKVIADV